MSLKLINLFKNKPWNYNELTAYLDIQYILENISCPFLGPQWNWYILSSRVTIEDVKKYPCRKWIWSKITENTDINYILNHLYEFPWNPTNLSSRVSLKTVIENGRFHWDIDILSRELPLEDILANYYLTRWSNYYVSMRATQQHIEKYPNFPWDYRLVHKVSKESVIKNINKNWNWGLLMEHLALEDILEIHGRIVFNLDTYILSRNTKLKIEDILNHQDIEWDYDYLSRVMNIEDIINNQKIKWNWKYVSANKSLKFEYVLNNRQKNWDQYSLTKVAVKENRIEYIMYTDLPWDYYYLSSLVGTLIDPKFVLETINEEQWNWEILSKVCPIEFIEQYIHLPWDYKFISSNPSITVKFIKAHEKKINFYNLSINPLTAIKKEFEEIDNLLEKIFGYDIISIINKF